MGFGPGVGWVVYTWVCTRCFRGWESTGRLQCCPECGQLASIRGERWEQPLPR